MSGGWGGPGVARGAEGSIGGGQGGQGGQPGPPTKNGISYCGPCIFSDETLGFESISGKHLFINVLLKACCHARHP